MTPIKFKHTKLGLFFVLMLFLCNTKAQQTCRFSITWHPVFDSINNFVPPFDECGSGDIFSNCVYVKEFATIKNDINPIVCISSFNDATLEFVSKSEKKFLDKQNYVVPDTVYYKVSKKIIDDSAHFVVNIFPYVKFGNTYKKVNSLSISYKFDTLISTNKSLKSNTYNSNSVLATGEWYKLAVNTTGIYKMSVSDFGNLGINVRGTAIENLALFGNGGEALPEKNYQFRANDLVEMAISVVDENDNGLFDNNDYILFFGESPNVWKYNSSSQQFEYQINRYSNENYYFFTATAGIGSEKRVSNIDESNLQASNFVTSYISRAYINNDLVNIYKTGSTWLGEKFSSSVRNRSFSLSVPEMVVGSTIKSRYALASISSANSSFKVEWLNGSNTCSYSASSPYLVETDSRTSAGGTSCSFSITYNFNESLATGYLDFIEINATSNLRFSRGQLDFRNFASTTDSISKIKIANCSSNIKVWDVSNHNNVKNIATQRVGDTISFVASSDSIREYIAFDNSSFLSPLRAVRIDNQNLHSQKSIDLVIVSHKNFLLQAEKIAELHRVYDSLTVLVVTPEEIYNEFSSGKQDAMAIRGFMKMLFDKSQTDTSASEPRYLLLFGAASYDNRNLLNNNQNVIVSYQTAASFDDDGASYATDEMFGFLHDNESGTSMESIDIGIGRLPARSVAQAQILTDKIERYIKNNDFEVSSVRGDWRNMVVLLADDADPGCESDVIFVNSTDYTADELELRYPNLNIEKIYADAYIQQSGAIGSFYPDAKNALTKKINYGCIFMNYVGHGSYDHIGSERYMERVDIPEYTNKYALPFFMASTCTWGRYDMTDETSGAEMFILAENGGGIGILAASRPIGHNRDFDTRISIELFASHNGQQNTIGDAYRIAKNAHQAPRAFVLLGDPALKLSLPKYNIAVTKINDKPICDSIADTIKVLSKVKIAGEVQNLDGSAINNFNGKLYTTVFDKKTSHSTLANDNEETEIQFTQQKSVLFKSQDTIANGKFEYSFIVPKDVSYKYDFGKLSHYAVSDNNENATGNYKHLLFGGFNEDAESEEFHPVVRLFINDSLFLSGGISNENPSIYAILSDKVGINSVGSGIGHDITAILDNNNNEIITLNDFFETDIKNSNKGYIKYPLYDLSEGTHTLTLKAWNIYNYSASASITFVVKTSDSHELGRFFTYPNPAKDKVSIQLEHNSESTPTNAEIYIYDASGRLVKKIIPNIVEGSSVLGKITWNFDNESGAKVGKGIYFLRAFVSFADGEQLSKYTKVIHL